MTVRCPNCQKRAGQDLELTNRYAHVNYYRCEACRHIWNVSGNDEPRVQHVTPIRPPRHGDRQKQIS